MGLQVHIFQTSTWSCQHKNNASHEVCAVAVEILFTRELFPLDDVLRVAQQLLNFLDPILHASKNVLI